VEPFDGLNLPFPESSFDLVFTSNVLEHVKDRPGLLREIERVTSLRGYAIHIVPSATWRLWTSVTRILHVAWRGRKNDKSLEDAEPLPDQMLPPRSVLDVMLGRPHGEYASAALELWWFRRSKWSQALRSSGFTQVASFGNRLFYTGYTFLPQLPLEARALASRVLGSSCHVFVLQRIDASPAGSPTVAERIGR
jgi:SAM-dependent methyltransferase